MSDTVKPTETYPCIVQDVFSGDDLIVFVDLGVNDIWLRKRVRLHGVDTPNAVNAAEDTDAGKIRREIRLLAKGRRGLISVVSKSPSSWVGVLVVEAPPPTGQINLNEMLIEKGHVFKRAGA